MHTQMTRCNLQLRLRQAQQDVQVETKAMIERESRRPIRGRGRKGETEASRDRMDSMYRQGRGSYAKTASRRGSSREESALRLLHR